MRRTHPARDSWDTELSSMKWQEGCFTASEPTYTRTAIRDCPVLQYDLLPWSWRNAYEMEWNKGHGSKEKSAKATEEQIKTLKERKSCLLFTPASLRQRNSSLGLAGKQLLSLWRQFQCRLVINAWIITSPQIVRAYSQNVKNTEKQTDVESICPGSISN